MGHHSKSTFAHFRKNVTSNSSKKHSRVCHQSISRLTEVKCNYTSSPLFAIKICPSYYIIIGHLRGPFRSININFRLQDCGPWACELWLMISREILMEVAVWLLLFSKVKCNISIFSSIVRAFLGHFGAWTSTFSFGCNLRIYIFDDPGLTLPL